MDIRQSCNAKDFCTYDTERLREEFLLRGLFLPGRVSSFYDLVDRMIVGGIYPVNEALPLEAEPELKAEYFLQRREIGCINIGGKGLVVADGREYPMEHRDGIYIGLGSRTVTFQSCNPAAPAKFYYASAPAHAAYPTVRIDISRTGKMALGTAEECNKRMINQFILPSAVKSCQLCMGLTELAPGSNWNSLPSHTHIRRTDTYFYFGMSEDDVVFHILGESRETRHIVVHNEEAVFNPAWSLHCGVGTKSYSFIWAMCGENQENMDFISIPPSEMI